ncbi:MAG: biosynthetic-type acetolactate synthase large subunit [Chloroflexi bacterium]|nr:biosynthetic-type acetolactate synthase large subunit [Chloroflexota bacterium]
MPATRMTGGQIVCEALVREGVDVIFGIPGGATLPLYATLSQYPALRHILVRHEQGGTHAADGYARATGRAGVVFATSGPGAMNLMTGLATAMMDSSPMVAITGQVARPTIGRDAFQETDITGATLPVTKHNYLVMNASDLQSTIRQAFHIARTGRPGPVLIDVPRDVFQEMAEVEDAGWDAPLELPGYHPPVTGDPAAVRAAARLINRARRPVALAGHGVIISRAYDELLCLAERAQIPVVTTFLGLSSFPGNHALSAGFPGMHGHAWASLALDEADLIVAIGSRFDDRITGDTERFATRSKKIHIDIDPAEIDKNVRADVPVLGNVKDVLLQLNPQVKQAEHADWLRRVEHLKAEHPSLRIRDTDELLPQHVIKGLYEATNGEATIVTGVGQHQMWTALHYQFHRPNTFMSSGGLGTMGFEIPAAMGVQVGRPGELVWSVAGDGGFQMTMSELATIAEHGLPVKFAIMHNTRLGMITQWQDLFYGKDFQGSMWQRNPDFVKLAEAFGIKGMRVTRQDEVHRAIREATDHPGPVVVEFRVRAAENVFPMIPSGQSVAELMEEQP